MKTNRACSLSLATVIAAVACGGSDSMGSTGSTSGGTHDTSFVLTGNPTAAGGATWTFKGTVDGVAYDLTGVLYRPSGSGPFPAVLLSHGADGNAASYTSLVAPTMVSWGAVCIGVNYTHAGSVPLGAPGTAADVGASAANIERAHMTYLLLRNLGYVDMSRVAAHGHSMGAFVTAAVVGAYPTDFRVASHTSGGVRPAILATGNAPSPSQVVPIRIPYQFHHGDADSTVNISFDQRFDSLLTANRVEHAFYVYPGLGHNDIRSLAQVLQRVHDWYQAHGLF